MENGNARQPTDSTSRRRSGGQWTSAQCVQKVEEMLSRAIIHQEDLWNILLLHSPENITSSSPSEDQLIPPPLLRSVKGKLENSMDWCHLALCRLKEIIEHTTSHELGQELEEEDDEGGGEGGFGETKLKAPNLPLGNGWSPGSFVFLDEGAQCAGEGSEQQLQAESIKMIPPSEGQRFSRLPSLPFDSDWNMLATHTEEARLSLLPATLSPCRRSSPPPEAAHQSSTSSGPLPPPENDCNAGENGAENNEKFNNRGLRPRSCGSKRVREETVDEKDTTVTVVFQELRPGDDTKKGIPDDGHRGWKKYGNKTIQNSTFCRGYYKCSMKDCRAKKMVQPTDKNPTIFEVTYVGNHTCSSTSRRRIRSRTSTARPTQNPTVESHTTTTTNNNTNDTTEPQQHNSSTDADVLVQTKIARLLRNQHQTPDQTASRTPPQNQALGQNQERQERGARGRIEAETDPDMGDADDSKEAGNSFDEVDEEVDESCWMRGDEERFGFASDSLLWQEIIQSTLICPASTRGDTSLSKSYYLEYT